MRQLIYQIIYTTIILGASAPLLLRAAADAPPPLSLSQYLGQVLTHDAFIAAARLRWEAVEARVPAAGTLPDPELSYGYFFSPIETRVGAQNQKFGLFQKIPWPTRLREQRALAQAGVDVAYFEYLNTVRQRIAQAKAAWIRLASFDEQLGILDQQLALLHDALTTLEWRVDPPGLRKGENAIALVASDPASGSPLPLEAVDLVLSMDMPGMDMRNQAQWEPASATTGTHTGTLTVDMEGEWTARLTGTANGEPFESVTTVNVKP